MPLACDEFVCMSECLSVCLCVFLGGRGSYTLVLGNCTAEQRYKQLTLVLFVLPG